MENDKSLLSFLLVVIVLFSEIHFVFVYLFFGSLCVFLGFENFLTLWFFV